MLNLISTMCVLKPKENIPRVVPSGQILLHKLVSKQSQRKCKVKDCTKKTCYYDEICNIYICNNGICNVKHHNPFMLINII